MFATTSGNAVTVGRHNEFDHITRVTPSTFTVLGVKPLLSRTLSSASGKPDGPREAVISYTLWPNAFGGNSDVLGRTLKVGDTTMRVVGVMPRKFVFPYPQNVLWTPLVITPALTKDYRNFSNVMLARMPRGSSLSRLDAFLRTVRDRALRSAVLPPIFRKGGAVVS